MHTVDFQKELFLLVHDWQMFRIDGQFIPDPQQGFNTGGLTLASDVHFAEDGVPKDLITVMAPPGMENDRRGAPLGLPGQDQSRLVDGGRAGDR